MPQFLRQLLHALYLVLMKTVVFFSPGLRHTVFAGSGSADQLCEHIVRTGVRRLLVVTDKPLRELGIADRATRALAGANIELTWYDGVLPDPTYDQVAAGVALARNAGCEAVLAVGGGSSIDCGKIIAASVPSADNPADWVGFGKVRHAVLPIYAIPTTSGTGSEATMGAVISNAQTHEKGVISGSTLLPAAAALDADLITGLPPHITAATGMDALTHAIEAYIGTWERGTRKADARIAVKLIFEYLPVAYRDGGNREARHNMAMGAYYAGLAINQVNVGNVHAIAHQLGGKYGIPHGLANALVLPHVLDFSRGEAEQALAELAGLIGAGSAGDSPAVLAGKFIEAVRDLRTQVGIADHAQQLRREDFDYLADLALAEGMQYASPRLLSRPEVMAILGRVAA